MIKAGVVFVDFVIMNTLLLLAAKYLYLTGIRYPPYFAANPRQIVLAANLAMIISQFSIGSIIHRRRTGIDEVSSQPSSSS